MVSMLDHLLCNHVHHSPVVVARIALIPVDLYDAILDGWVPDHKPFELLVVVGWNQGTFVRPLLRAVSLSLFAIDVALYEELEHLAHSFPMVHVLRLIPAHIEVVVFIEQIEFFRDFQLIKISRFD